MADIKIITGATGDKNVNAEDDRANNYATYGVSGIIANNGYTVTSDNYYNPTEAMDATLLDANTVQITRGDIVLQGCHARIPYGSTVELTIEPGVAGYKRIDCIVAHYHRDELGVESVALEVVQGTPQQAEYTEITAQQAVQSVCSGSMYHNDSDVIEVLWTVYINGTTVNTPKRYTAVISPLRLMQEVLDSTNVRRNSDVTNILNPLGEVAKFMQSLLGDAWDQQTDTEKISRLKEMMDRLATVLIAGADSDPQDIMLVKNYNILS